MIVVAANVLHIRRTKSIPHHNPYPIRDPTLPKPERYLGMYVTRFGLRVTDLKSSTVEAGASVEEASDWWA